MPPFGRLEPEFREDYAAWKQQPTPTNAGRLLSKLKPTIRKGLHAHLGTFRTGPNLQSHAKRITLQALKTYDPSQAQLGTHVINHLQGLKRAARKSRQILSVPERVSLDQTYVWEQSAQLADELGREPSTQELADRTGLSAKRLAYLKQFKQPVAEGTLTALPSLDGDASGGLSPAIMSGQTDMVVEAVYGDLDGANQKILEWTLGLHGEPALSNQAIAVKLGISPGAVSQRKSLIQAKLDEAEGLGLF